MKPSRYPFQLDALHTVADIEQALSKPTPAVIEGLALLPGDLLVLGVGGKMGPTLALMARKASDAAGARRRIIGVARFSSGDLEARLQGYGMETVRADLLDPAQLARLPDAPNVIYMAGMKFGSTGNEALTWAMNCYLPGLVCERYASSRIAAFSTGNVYGLTPIAQGGSLETDAPKPVGDYAMSCVGRERIFQHFSLTRKTAVTLIRLNYAAELRYGVPVDLALRIQAGEPVDLAMGHFNMIWQPDANALVLLSLAHAASPALVLNVTGPELLRVRDVAAQIGERLGKPVRFCGEEASDALLSNASLARRLFGPPRLTATEVIDLVAAWVRHGGATLDKPTHFDARNGKF